MPPAPPTPGVPESRGPGRPAGRGRLGRTSPRRRGLDHRQPCLQPPRAPGPRADPSAVGRVPPGRRLPRDRRVVLRRRGRRRSGRVGIRRPGDGGGAPVRGALPLARHGTGRCRRPRMGVGGPRPAGRGAQGGGGGPGRHPTGAGGAPVPRPDHGAGRPRGAAAGASFLPADARALPLGDAGRGPAAPSSGCGSSWRTSSAWRRPSSSRSWSGRSCCNSRNSTGMHRCGCGHRSTAGGPTPSDDRVRARANARRDVPGSSAVGGSSRTSSHRSGNDGW